MGNRSFCVDVKALSVEEFDAFQAALKAERDKVYIVSQSIENLKVVRLFVTMDGEHALADVVVIPCGCSCSEVTGQDLINMR
jgi:hypothetical protein